MSRRMRLRAGCCIGIACFALAAVSGTAAGQAAHQSRTCSPPEYPGSGYFTSLSVRGVGCKKGRSVTMAHYRCRTESGPSGRCHRRVLGYGCRETRHTIPSEIDARVTCRRGGLRVIYTYQQNR